MFVILAVGFLAGKLKIINSTASKNLSKLIIAVGQPALIINSITSKTFSKENLDNAFSIHYNKYRYIARKKSADADTEDFL